MDLSNLSLTKLVHSLTKMGCMCFKPSVVVEGVRYRVVRQLAEGGFSTVDLVEDSRSGKKYAMKRITCHSTEDQNLATREVEITSSLEHPNIVIVVGSSTSGTADIVHNYTSQVLIVFPFYQRGTLHDELERRQLTNSPLPQATLLSIFSSICSAVKELHHSSPPLSHRDIKPHNILLDKDLSPVLMDFGSTTSARVTISNMKEAQYLQDTAAERSSMCYRPPELFQVNSSCDLDERTDIWSLGCLLYAMMFYQSPYDPIYERGDSVALAVQSGKISFPPSSGQYTQELLQLVTEMTNVDINFRIRIDSVIEKVEKEMAQKCDKL
eukprot:GFUD01016397.1.p1 GENE.GFUD01016397.1~~GFUD01016397.1.p1  ORF type:complete len:325 (-),score=133.48 GFUD01016397.1:44-1018(-)